MFFQLLLSLVLLPLSDQLNEAEQKYSKLFKFQRMEQLEALKNFRKHSNIQDQHRTVKIMSEKIFSVLQESRAELESSYYIPAVSDFPQNERTRDALSNVLENTALFYELILHYPDVTRAILESNNNWKKALEWGRTFAEQMKYLLDEGTLALFSHIDAGMQNNNSHLFTTEESVATKKATVKKKKSLKKKGPSFSREFEL